MARNIRWAAGALCVLLVGCARPDSEEQLRAQVAAIETALEARSPDALDDLLAEDFVGPEAMDRGQARRMAQLAFLRYRDVGVALGPAAVDIEGERATVKLTAMLSGGSGAVLPDSASAYAVESGWRQVGGEWQLLSVEWTPVR